MIHRTTNSNSTNQRRLVAKVAETVQKLKAVVERNLAMPPEMIVAYCVALERASIIGSALVSAEVNQLMTRVATLERQMLLVNAALKDVGSYYEEV